MKEEIKSHLESIIGSKLNVIHGAAGLAWFEFGEVLWAKNPEEQRSGRKSQYNLCISSSFHIKEHGKVVVTSEDFYSPSPDWYKLHGENTPYDWSLPGGSKFEEKVMLELMTKIQHEPPIVEKIYSDETGRIKVFLSKGLKLSVYPTLSEHDEGRELWRFFAHNSDWSRKPHFIVTIDNISKTS